MRLIGGALFAIVALASVVLGQTSPVSSSPPYKLLRYEEDWSFLRDPTRRSDFWDPIKYIPLGGKDQWYLSIGGELRPYYEFYRHEEWGAEPRDDNGFLLQRYILHADLHMGQRVRLFGQLKSGIELGRRGGPRPPDEDKLDLHQAFVDVNVGLGHQRSLTVRAGRQELNYGSARLVTVREGPNMRLSFDGVRAIMLAGAWRVDGFVTKPVETDRGIFDDGPVPGQTFWGVYAVRPLAVLPKKGHIDLYYLGLDRKRARFNQGVGREKRHTIGTRLWNRAPTWDYNFELVYQFGTFGSGDICAWTVASDTGYTFQPTRFQPRIGLKANVTSGDKDPTDQDLETFHPLFPRGAYFGQLVSVGPLNHIDLHPTLDLEFPRGVSLTADWVFYWRQSTRDGVYGIPGNLLRTGQLSRARDIGHQPGIEVRWQIDRHTTFTVNYARFYAGRFLRETPPGHHITYFAAWVTYRF